MLTPSHTAPPERTATAACIGRARPGRQLPRHHATTSGKPPEESAPSRHDANVEVNDKLRRAPTRRLGSSICPRPRPAEPFLRQREHPLHHHHQH